MKPLIKMSNTIIINRVLYGALSMKYSNYQEASSDLSISVTYLRKLVFDGKMPSVTTQRHLAIELGIPEHILFNREDIEKRKTFSLNKIDTRIVCNYVCPEDAPGDSVGVKKPRFRIPHKRIITRPVLMAILLSENIKVSELAKMLKISPRSCIEYIYGTSKPRIYKSGVRDEKVDLIEKILDFKFEYLFFSSKFEIENPRT